MSTIPDADKPSDPAVSGEPSPDATPNVPLPVPDEVPSRSSRAHGRRTSPHSLLFQASAVLECMRIATLYGDFHDIPYLLLSDACASADGLIDRALELMGDDVADLPDDDSDLADDDDADLLDDESDPPDDDDDLDDDVSNQPDDTTAAEPSP